MFTRIAYMTYVAFAASMLAFPWIFIGVGLLMQ
jgi:hypothetical protein